VAMNWCAKKVKSVKSGNSEKLKNRFETGFQKVMIENLVGVKPGLRDCLAQSKNIELKQVTYYFHVA
jgi:hypothetical protein